MRHRIHHRRFNRTSEHRLALRRNMAQSLIEHGQITTTLSKARDIRPFVEKLITLAVQSRKRTAAGDRHGALSARRTLERLLTDRCVIPAKSRREYEAMSDAARAKSLYMASGRRYRSGEPKGRLDFTADSVTRRLVEFIAPQFEDRPGGYTRLVRLATWRIGDGSPLAVVRLIGGEEAPISLTKPLRSARRRRADARYALAIAASKNWSRKEKSAGTAAPSKRAAEESESS